MELTKISIQNFKKIKNAEFQLGKINYLVGGNNAGKSSILQAIHCAVTAAQSQVENDGARVLAEENLKYSPAGDFNLLGHRKPLENSSYGHRATILFSGMSDSGDEASYSVKLYKGRNNRNVGIERSGSVLGFGSHVYSRKSPFSVFVPGLAGVANYEEFKAEASVFRRIAGGEANLYLRNVFLILKKRNLLDEFTRLARLVFPDLRIEVEFNQEKDIYIDVKVRTNDSSITVPLDLVGTGVLQALQIFAYATLAKPALLLLDEPDAHLHPSNQALLVQAFEVISENTETKIVLATHSRHLLNSAPDSANIFWVDNGTIKQDQDLDLIKLLMEIGALDEADAIIGRNNSLIIATEDTDTRALALLLSKATEREYTIIKLNGVSNSSIAREILDQLIPHFQGNPRVIFHRDRDFMTDDEVDRWKEKIETDQIKCFVTNGSDIESYYLNPSHLAAVAQVDVENINQFLDELLRENSRDIRNKFASKRREINIGMNRDGGAPRTEDLLPNNDIPSVEHVVGKFLLKKIRSKSNERIGIEIDPICQPQHNLSPELTDMIEQMYN